jgi:hypothetical protein
MNVNGQFRYIAGMNAMLPRHCSQKTFLNQIYVVNFNELSMSYF